MSEAMNYFWQVCAVIAAVYLIIRRVRRPQREVAAPRPSLAGRVGGHLIAQAVLSAVSGVLGFNVVMACFALVLAIPLMLIGAKVELPEFVKAWPRSVASRVTGAFAETKESSAPSASPASDEEDEDAFWGGPPDPSASAEVWQDEIMAFDALPAERKLASLRFAEPVDASSVPKEVRDDIVLDQWYRVRCGRSAYCYRSAQRIELYARLWEAEQDGLVDATASLHYSRLSDPSKKGELNECLAAFDKLPPAVQFAACNSVYKFKRPLPDSVHLVGPDIARDEQYYELRICECWSSAVLTREQLDIMKNYCLTRLKAAEAAEAEERKNRPTKAVAEVKGKAKGLADRLKAKAGAAASKAKSSAARGAKGLFWKVLGY